MSTVAGVGAGPVLNTAVLTAVAPAYAPPGRHLVQATTLLPTASTEPDVRRQLADLWAVDTSRWELVTVHDVVGALARPARTASTYAGPSTSAAACSSRATTATPARSRAPSCPARGRAQCRRRRARAHRMRAQGPPLPTRQVMSQWWRDISFLHWRVDPDVVAPLLPRGVRPDVYDGSGWVGLIPFRMVDAGLGRRGPVPRLGTFLETNVRLYSVDDAGRHGVVFRSLEADRLPVVAAARLGFGVPYQWARLSIDPLDVGPDRQAARSPTAPGAVAAPGAGGPHRRRGRRPDRGARPARALPHRPLRPAHDGGRAHPLGAQHATGRGRCAARGPLQVEDTLMTAAGLPELTGSPPESVLFSTGVRTVFGLPQRL